MSSLIQYTGRMITLYFYMEPTSCFCSMRNVIIPWSFAEIIRFSYYLNKTNGLFTFLRYNAFLVLYPFGIIGEIRCIRDYVARHEGELTQKIGLAYQLVLIGILYDKQF